MRKLLSAGLIVMALAVRLAAQNPPAPAGTGQNQGDTPAERIKVRVDLVNVLFTAIDKKNRLILNLTKEDFNILEDNKPQAIRYFSRETNLPLRIAVLIDTSNSVRDRLRFEQEAAIDFLTSTLRPVKDQAFVVGFDVEPQLLQDYTDDMEKLSTAIRGLQTGGTTALYDTIYYACREKMLIFPPPEPYLRRVMVVITDGNDNSSIRTREEALAMAQRAEVTIFAISTNWRKIEDRGDKVLQRFSAETGGRTFFPFSHRELAADFEEISRELRSQYSLAYTSSNPARDGTFRTIRIEPRERDYKVRAKSGYFAASAP